MSQQAPWWYSYIPESFFHDANRESAIKVNNPTQLPAIGNLSNAELADPAVRKGYFEYLNGLDNKGYSFSGKDGDITIDPDTIAFLKSTGAYYDNAYTTEDAIRNQITSDVGKLYERRGVKEALGGFTDYNDRIQTGLNNMYMQAQYLLKSPNLADQERGRYMMGVVTRGQDVFNQAQPQVRAAVQSRLNNKWVGLMNFAQNNWWWMLPAGGALLYGLYNMSGQNRNPNNQKTMRPEGWSSDIVEQPQGQTQNLQQEQGLEDEEY